MVAKKKKAQKKNTKKSEVSSPKVEAKTKKMFFQDIEFNLHVIVYLFGINIILISVVLFYVSEIQVLTEIQADNNKVLPFEDFTYYKYSQDEFAKFAKYDVSTAKGLEIYALENDFDVIVRREGFFHGEKNGDCFNDLTRDERRCKKAIVEYNENNPGVYEAYIVREYQFDLES